MELTIAGIVTALGILFGMNFLGLFIAAYVFNRRAVHILFYLAAIASLMTMGLAYLLSMLTPYTGFWIVCVELCLALSLLLFAYGFARALQLSLSKGFIWGMFVAGSLATIAVSGLPEMNVLRLSVVSAWHTIIALYLAAAIFRAADTSLQNRIIGLLLIGLALATINRPLTAIIVQLQTSWSHTEQTAVYGATVATFFLMALFGLGAAVFFQVMSDLATGYRRASIQDSLTSLLNRRGFFEASNAMSTRPMTLIMLDVDEFKMVNDNFGHAKGDQILVETAKIMKRAAPAPHICGRLGGEEFAILLHLAERRTGEALAQSIRTAIEVELAQLLPAGQTVTASFGVTELDGRGLDQALIAADHALYDAKKGGRNRVCVATTANPTQKSRTGERRAVLAAHG